MKEMRFFYLAVWPYLVWKSVLGRLQLPTPALKTKPPGTSPGTLMRPVDPHEN
jgi:hypothetical protein